MPAHSHIEYDPSVDFGNDRLVAVMSTYYDNPDDIRYQLAQETARRYGEQDAPLVVMDASPSDEVGASFRAHNALVIRAPRPGLATQYMDGIQFAVDHGASGVVRHEPEKVGMINFHEEIIGSLAVHDIVVIGRTERAMDSLPPTQAETERLGGWLLEHLIQLPPDALSGGRGYTPRGAGYLARYDVEAHGNNWLHLYRPILEAMEDGVPIGGIQVDLMHPEIMTAEETGNTSFDLKRYKQLVMQLNNLLPIVGFDPQPAK